MKYYFMDYENVRISGFDGIEKLEKNDIIYVIYSEQSKSFSLDILEKAQKQGIIIEAYKVNVGNKNALDFQLSSFLGYIVGKSEDNDCEYIIVSKDTGYDKVVEFWTNRNKRIYRLINLFEKANNNLTNSNSNEEKVIVGMTSDSKINSSKKELSSDNSTPTSNVKTKELGKEDLKKENMPQITKEELIQVLSKEEYSDKILEIVNSFKTKQAINNSLGKVFKDGKKCSLIYNKLKPLLKEKKKS